LIKKIILILVLLFFITPTIISESFLIFPSYDYVIITTNEIKNNSEMLDDFLEHKQNFGFKVLIVTENEYEKLTGQAPNSVTEKIRQWLKNNYLAMGIKYVLLIGNPDPDNPINPYDHIGEIPMKICMLAWDPKNIFYTFSLLKDKIPTDYYYADLTGNWDFDGDLIYGEFLDDYYFANGEGVNFIPEVFVGRIPVYNDNYDDLDHILQKTIDYEIDNGNLSWRKNVLLPMSFVNIWYDYAHLGEQIKDDLLIPNNFSYWRMYQQGSAYPFENSQYLCEEELREGSMKERWIKDDFGIICWTGHGYSTSTMIGAKRFSDGILFCSNDCKYLDDEHPAFTVQLSCLNGQPDVQDNLGYSLLRQGAITTVSSTVTTWIKYEFPGDFIESFSSGGIAFDYISNLINGFSAGESLYESKMSPLPKEPVQIGFICNIYGFNLYGDPSLCIIKNK